MKYIYIILSVFLCLGCADKVKIQLNDSAVNFESFPTKDSLKFIVISDQILEEPSKILLSGDNLIVQTFCKAQNNHVTIYSLTENRVLNEVVKFGDGPKELISCDIEILDDKLWLYDMSKMRIGFAPVDSFLLSTPYIEQKKINSRYYYNTAMLNDSIMLGTNDLISHSKITYINLRSDVITGKGEYSYLDNDTDLEALKDASSCYIDVNPQTKDILLTYRYTDMIEIYNSEGELKHALHGPVGFDIEFQTARNNGISSMAKTKNTRKAYVNTYVTGDYVYLLFSGCKRNERNWAFGSVIYVFTWDGKPKKQYFLEQPIYTFAVDEDKQILYSYLMQTEELVKANM